MPTTSQQTFINNTAWSAAFISYVMKTAGVDFPTRTSHTAYAQDLRRNSRGFQVLNPLNSKLQVGDIVVANRSENNVWNTQTYTQTTSWTGVSHGDIVVSVSPTSARIIGGNLSDTVGFNNNLTLVNGGITSTSLQDKRAIPFVILRPPQDKVTTIVDTVNTERSKWNDGRLKDNNDAALPLLQNYYTTVGLSIPSYTVTSGTFLSVSDYERTTYVTPINDDEILKLLTVPSAPRSATTNAGGVSTPSTITFLQDLKNRIALNQVIINEQQLAGELALLDNTDQALTEYRQQTQNIITNIGNFIPSEQYFLVAQNLFEFFPDRMREEMASETEMPSGKLGINTITPANPHAWRAPGKLATTVELTIPGVAGFSIGQIFWVDRISEQYKKIGAFQVFGLTETITMDRGWTTNIYARLNIIPFNIMAPYFRNQT